VLKTILAYDAAVYYYVGRCPI